MSHSAPEGRCPTWDVTSEACRCRPRRAAACRPASTSWGRRCATSRSSSSTSRRPAGRPPSSASPRSARSRCAAARCSASSTPWSTRATPIPPFIAVLTGITDAMVAERARASRGAAGLPRVRRAARCWSPTTRRSTSASSRRPAAPHRPGLAARRRWSTRPGWRGRAAHARRGAQLQARARWRASSGRHRAGPPRARRRPGDGRRAARPDRAGRLAGRPHRSRSSRRTPPGSARRSGASATSPTALPARPGVYLFEDDAGRVLYVGKSRRPAHPGAHLLHRLARSGPAWREMVALAERGARRSCAPPRWRPRCASCG